MMHSASNPYIMNDHQIRFALKKTDFARYYRDPNTFVIDELGLRHGSAIIDLVVINGDLHGFEIKSEADNLSRLTHQAKIYSSVLDKVTLVVASSHLVKAKRIIPSWWGIKVVERDSNSRIYFLDKRKAERNPRLDVIGLTKLLWRNEALDFLNELGAGKGLTYKPRAEIYKRVSEVAHVDAIRERVIEKLRYRKIEQFDALQKLGGD